MAPIDYNSPIIPGGSFKWREYAWLPRWKTNAVPTEAEKQNAILLFINLEKYIRKPLGKSLLISGGARTKAYAAYLRSQGIPAATMSAHNEWKGVDILAPSGMTNIQFWQWCHKRWPGRMENYTATPGWVHFDTRDFGKWIRFNP